MSGWATLRERLGSLILSVEGTGKVHTRKRSVKFLEAFYAAHRADGILNSWEITREGFASDHNAVGEARGFEPIWHRTHLCMIIGRMSVQDAKESEHIFQDLVDDVADAFRDDPLIGLGDPNSPFCVVPVQPVTGGFTETMFGKVLCHEVRITFGAVERTLGNELL